MSAGRLEIRLAGSGGQGLITGMRMLFHALALGGRRAAQSQSYEPTSRGGFCFSDLVVADDPADYPLAIRLDMAAALSQIGLDRSLLLIKPDALVLVDSQLAPEPPRRGFDVRVLPMSDRAIALGSARVANVVALGALSRLAGLCPPEALEEAVRLETPPKFAALNLAAAREGFALAAIATAMA
jgi:2-oxoglutarate ferredoxin oxidoreductase subunit gamma